MSKISIKTKTLYLPLLLATIFLDEICDNHLLSIFSERDNFQKLTLFVSFLLLQIIASPFQAGYSDFYSRKKSLIASLVFSSLGVLLTFLYFESFAFQFLLLAFAAVAKGVLGNTLPIAWAGIADTKNQNYRFSLGLSTSTIALGYFALILISNVFNQKITSLIIILLFLILIFFICRLFFDLREVDVKHVSSTGSTKAKITKKNEIKKFLTLIFADFKILKENYFKSLRFRRGLFYTFFTLEISFYSIHLLGVDLVLKKFELLTLSMILGYILGVMTLGYFKNKKDADMIIIGYRISIISFFPLYAAMLLQGEGLRWTIAVCYFFYSFGAAFIVPSLFSTLSKERETHEQGKIYGLVDSTDTLALLLASIVAILYNLLKLNQFYIISFSVIMFLISRLYYATFRRTKSYTI